MKTIVFLLDETGSMEPHRAETIAAFNKYVADIRKADLLFSLTLFDSSHMERRHKAIPAADVPDLTEETYKPGAMTPLYDAMGQTIKETEGEALMVILTDGLENASHEYTFDGIKALIERKKADDKWEFLFLASDLKVAESGIHLAGINSVSPTSSPDHAFRTASLATADYAAGKTMASASHYANTAKTEDDKEPETGWKATP
jgi:hypothetical protein